MTNQATYPSPFVYGTRQELSNGYQTPTITGSNITSNVSPQLQSSSGRTARVSKVNLVRCIINAHYRHVVTPDGAHFLMPIDGGPVLIPETEIVAPLIKKIAVSYTHLTLPTKRIV